MAASRMNDPVDAIVDKLLTQTQTSNIKWKPTDDGDTFLFAGTSSSVTVTSFVDPEEDRHVIVSVKNAEGTEVASVRSQFIPGETMPGMWSNSYKAGPRNAVLEQLYEFARRNALEIDTVLNSLLGDLDSAGNPF